jgi:hypothetical protein
MCSFIAGLRALDQIFEQCVVNGSLNLRGVLLLAWVEQAETLVEFDPKRRAAGLSCAGARLDPVGFLLPVGPGVWRTFRQCA